MALYRRRFRSSCIANLRVRHHGGFVLAALVKFFFGFARGDPHCTDGVADNVSGPFFGLSDP